MPKVIEEFVGRVNSGTAAASIAMMTSPSGWEEPGQAPEGAEYVAVGLPVFSPDGRPRRLIAVGGGRPSGRAVPWTAVTSGIEQAYGQEPEDRLRGCAPCSVTWFGTEDSCWVCGRRGDGPVAAVPPNGSETWSATRCAGTADAEETSALLRRVITA